MASFANVPARLILPCALTLCSALIASAQKPSTKQNTVNFDPARTKLYTQEELMHGRDSAKGKMGWDVEVYHLYVEHGGAYADRGIARRESLHDDSIAYALRQYAAAIAAQHKQIVGIMGNALEDERCSVAYRQTAELGYELTRAGYIVSTGGGPGEMEAANLGAYLAHYEPSSLDAAIEIFRKYAVRSADPTMCSYASHAEYEDAAIAVLKSFPNGSDNLGVPTWFYGHEPSNAFATHVAKFFSNAIREDALLAYANGGVIFTEGRAGLRQEIFQKLTMNDFDTTCYTSPLVFLGKKEFERGGLYPLILDIETPYKSQPGIATTDSVKETVAFLKSHPAKRTGGTIGLCRNVP
ncbi:MAG: hypothetical protein PW792_04830 [Acidobacteriaceae bacterium]|nr:hypothetical protein [Acidobacteriaceae bacterium]